MQRIPGLFTAEPQRTLRQKAHLLDYFLLSASAIFIIVDTILVLSSKMYTPPWHGYALMLIAFIANRLERFYLAAGIIIGMFPLVLYLPWTLPNISSMPPRIDSLFYILPGVLLTSILLDYKKTIAVYIVYFLGMVSLPLIARPGQIGYTDIISPLSVLLLVSILTAIFHRYRDRVSAKAQRLLVQQKQSLQLIIDHQSELIVKVNNQGELVFASKTVYELLEDPEKKQATFSELFVDTQYDELPIFAYIQSRFTESPRPVYIELQGPDMQWYGWQFTLLSGEGECAFIGVGRNISATKYAIDALRASENRYRSLIDNFPDYIFQLATDETFLYCSKNVYALEQKPPQQILGKRPAEIGFPPEVCAFFSDTITKSKQQGSPFNAQLRYFAPAGGRLVLSITVKPEYDEQQQVISVMFIGRDITKQTELSQRLAQTDKLETLGHLARGVAHNFTNQLRAIQGYANSLLASQNSDVHYTHLARTISHIAAQADELPRQLLAFTSTTSTLKQVPLDLTQCVYNTLIIARGVLDKKIKISSTPPSEPMYVAGEQSQLQQVFLNMVINARDAMPSGGSIEISFVKRKIGSDFRSEFGFQLTGGYYCGVSIADSGHGIQPGIRQKLFEPFLTTKNHLGATGLGLAIAYNSVKNHHGAIELQNRFGSGATFTVLLPCAEKK